MGGVAVNSDNESKNTKSNDAEYDAELARMEEEERLDQIHQKKVEKEWLKVESLSQKKGKRGIKLI